MADKDKQPQQADFDKAWENIKAGKTMPSENDMGPTQEEVAADRARMERALLKGAKEGTGGKKLGMKKGGKVSSASKRADGCCIRGKTRA